jgi:hypothetical protein
MSQRYFAVILAPSKQALAKLQAYDLDLFHSTAGALAALTAAVPPPAEEGAHDEYSIEGLMTLEEIGRLVDDGYKVTIHASGTKPTPAQTETVDFEQWRSELEE